jgi:hypothetical protein
LSELEGALEPVDELALEESTDEPEDVPAEVVEAHPARTAVTESPVAVAKTVRPRRMRFMSTN